MQARHWIGAGVVGVVAAVAAIQFSVTAKPDGAGPAANREANVKVHVFNRDGKLVGPVESAKVVKTDAEWRKLLPPETYKVVRSKGTERPFCGTLLDNKKEGVYACVACGLPLYGSDSKFNSGTGWPSFFKPIGDGNIAYEVDESHGMTRTEMHCGRCDGHLGHVFDDGPAPTGKRHCVNSESLKFYAKDELAKLADPAAELLTTKPATQPAGK